LPPELPPEAPPAPLILAFDTAGAHCAAALLRGTRVLAERILPMPRGQGERLFPVLEELLAATGTDWRALEALAVGTGPGNFTGIRISVAAARGLALALGIPAAGVSGFEALACGRAGPVLASIDGRGGRLYLGRIAPGRNPPPLSTRLDALPAALPEGFCPPGCTVIGHEAGRIAAALGCASAEAACSLPVAIGRVAAGRALEREPRPAPLYLRPPDAAPARDAPPALLP